MEDQVRPENNQATFTCEVNKDDEEVTWLHDLDKLPVNERKYSVSKEGRKHSLTVHDLQPKDAGKYTARVKAPDGKVKDTTAALEVTGWSCTMHGSLCNRVRSFGCGMYAQTECASLASTRLIMQIIFLN